jgi:uncharacterized metal-binding protein
MPSGKIHAAATVIAAGVVSPLLALVARQPVEHAAAFAAGCMVGLVVTPDLDVRHRDTHSETIIRRTGGCFPGALWNLFWLPYAYLVPCHRHWLSHAPLLGTALRVIYLLLVPALFWWILGHFLPMPRLPAIALTPTIWWGLGGLALVDALHALMDKAF